ncbi:hypothetical protein [Brevibacillus laterosporus]|uniref:Uncharacterized protein n=1 Tax=Brevibacillus laterosporus LMG 15441 TaxID=1042163 RepID=A0A075RCY7_BRELA|nr:hypothetical protein BRLA_c029730 [Brevibacillus laterosporus LMG 15441]ERM16156.1 hypothetical protein P615_05590 [Brevibacillus laterosporus PE36]
MDQRIYSSREAGQSIAPKEIAAMQKEMLRLKQEVEEMKGIGNNWNVIRGMVIKMHLTKRYNDNTLEKLSQKIMEVSQDERCFAVPLLE